MKEAFPKVAFINNNTAVTKPRRVQRKRAGPRYSDDSGISNFFKKKKKNGRSERHAKQQLTSKASVLMQTNSHDQVKQV